MVNAYLYLNAALYAVLALWCTLFPGTTAAPLAQVLSRSGNPNIVINVGLQLGMAFCSPTRVDAAAAQRIVLRWPLHSHVLYRSVSMARLWPLERATLLLALLEWNCSLPRALWKRSRRASEKRSNVTWLASPPANLRATGPRMPVTGFADTPDHDEPVNCCWRPKRRPCFERLYRSTSSRGSGLPAHHSAACRARTAAGISPSLAQATQFDPARASGLLADDDGANRAIDHIRSGRASRLVPIDLAEELSTPRPSPGAAGPCWRTSLDVCLGELEAPRQHWCAMPFRRQYL